MKAILFDFDGTLVDTQHLYNKALSQVLSKFNPVYTIEYCTNFFDGKCWNDAFEMLAIQENFHKEAVFSEALALAYNLISGDAKATNGTTEALTLLREMGVKYAICSNSHTHEIHSVLKATGLDGFFVDGNIFGRDMVKNGKPASDIYLLGLEKMGIDKEKCIAVEDSINGAKASINADIQTIIFTGGSSFTGGFSNIARFSSAFGSVNCVEDMRKIVEYV